jgi:hypothetical protein
MIECDGKMQGYDLEYAWSMTKPADCRSITVASFNHLKWHPSGHQRSSRIPNTIGSEGRL